MTKHAYPKGFIQSLSDETNCSPETVKRALKDILAGTITKSRVETFNKVKSAYDKMLKDETIGDALTRSLQGMTI